jgi:hypothetical protein
VPALAEADDRAAAETVFAALHDYLGVGVGETLGYLFTGAWTILVLVAMASPPRWLAALGAISALAIWAGLLVPLGVPGADTLNFIGYIAWSGWMLCLAAFASRLLNPAGALPGP